MIAVATRLRRSSTCRAPVDRDKKLHQRPLKRVGRNGSCSVARNSGAARHRHDTKRAKPSATPTGWCF